MQYFGFDRPSFAFKTFGFGANFDPLDLFAGGKQGVWYDPSDKTTLFQDVAGAVPVTKDGDPVALILDKSQAMELSDNLTPLINFNDGSRWGKGYPSNEISEDGKTILTTSTAGGISLTGLNNGWYKLSMEYTVNGPPFKIRDGYSGKDFSSTSINSPQTLIIYISNNSLSFRTSGAQASLTIHEMVLQELKGNHASQPLAASRPTYRTDGVLHWLEFDGVDDYLEVKPFAAAMQQPYSFVAGVQRMATAGSASLVDCDVDATRFAITDLKQNNYMSAGITATNKLPAASGDKHVLTVFVSGIDSRMQSGKGGIVTADIGNNPINNILIATRDKSIGFSKNNLYGMLFVKGAIVEQGQVQDYLAAKSGVTL